MMEFVATSAAVQAALLVGAVLLEAIGLYVGYGVVERRLAPPVFEAIANA